MNAINKNIKKTKSNLLDKIRGKYPDIIVKIDPYHIDYINSYAEDSLFFQKLQEGKLMGSKCENCSYTFATPRGYCTECGAPTEWLELPLEGKIHTFTVCNFGGEEFLKECPYILILVEFKNINRAFLSRLTTDKKKNLENELLKMNQREASKLMIGRTVKAQFKKNCENKITDVYFVLK